MVKRRGDEKSFCDHVCQERRKGRFQQLCGKAMRMRMREKTDNVPSQDQVLGEEVIKVSGDHVKCKGVIGTLFGSHMGRKKRQ
jgi:hypothetical protein